MKRNPAVRGTTGQSPHFPAFLEAVPAGAEARCCPRGMATYAAAMPARSAFLLQRSHVDDEAIFHVSSSSSAHRPPRSSIRIVSISAVMPRSAPIEHLLRLDHAADRRKPAIERRLSNGLKISGGVRMLGRADQRHRCRRGRQHQERVEIVRDGDGVQDEVEAVGVRHRLERSRETTTSWAPASSHPRSCRAKLVKATTYAPIAARKLDAHMTKAADADHADLLAGPAFPVAEWRIGGDTGANSASREARESSFLIRGECAPRDVLDDIMVRIAAERVPPGTCPRHYRLPTNRVVWELLLAGMAGGQWPQLSTIPRPTRPGHRPRS